MNITTDSTRVKFFCPFNRSHVLGIRRFLYEARSRTNERRSISRNHATKRARDLADPAAERVFRQCLPRSIRVEGPPPARDWSFGSSVHAHKRPQKSKPLTVDAPTNPRCGGTKYGAASFLSGAPYRRATDQRVPHQLNILGRNNPPQPKIGKCSRWAEDWRPNRCMPYPAWASGAQP